MKLPLLPLDYQTSLCYDLLMSNNPFYILCSIGFRLFNYISYSVLGRCFHATQLCLFAPNLGNRGNIADKVFCLFWHTKVFCEVCHVDCTSTWRQRVVRANDFYRPMRNSIYQFNYREWDNESCPFTVEELLITAQSQYQDFLSQK